MKDSGSHFSYWVDGRHGGKGPLQFQMEQRRLLLLLSLTDVQDGRLHGTQLGHQGGDRRLEF
jgi:hypothetical protein